MCLVSSIVMFCFTKAASKKKINLKWSDCQYWSSCIVFPFTDMASKWLSLHHKDENFDIKSPRHFFCLPHSHMQTHTWTLHQDKESPSCSFFGLGAESTLSQQLCEIRTRSAEFPCLNKSNSKQTQQINKIPFRHTDYQLLTVQQWLYLPSF